MRFTDEGLNEDFKISVQLLTQVLHNKTLGDDSKKKMYQSCYGTPAET